MKAPLRKIVFATRNPHKVEEVQAILSDLPLEIVTLADFPEIGDIEESGQTFEENALIKARAAYQATGLWSMADDSGLEVDALDGAPGIYSARYAGEGHDYAANNEKLLHALRDVPQEKRTAQFRCVVAIVGPGFEKTVEGIIRGRIADKPRGHKGFGYDPIFIPDGYRQTFAQLGESIKNKISHRARAFQQAAQVLEALLEDSSASR